MFTHGTGPPGEKKAAPGEGAPSAAINTDERPSQTFEVRDKPSDAARQVCREILRQDIGAALHLAIGNAVLALRYLEADDDPALRYLVHRFHLYARFATETARELRKAA
jgi:hypothetical protein